MRVEILTLCPVHCFYLVLTFKGVRALVSLSQPPALPAVVPLTLSFMMYSIPLESYAQINSFCLKLPQSVALSTQPLSTVPTKTSDPGSLPLPLS